MSSIPPRRSYLAAFFSTLAAALVASCKSAVDLGKPEPVTVRPPSAPPPAAAFESAPVIGPIAGPSGSARSSSAITPRAYREDGATHLYGLNRERIFKGRMPPLLYAIGVLNIHIDRAGRVTDTQWMRAPKHAPEVMAEIIKTVQQASPFPVPARLGNVVYTDTWLWHKSGQFQLDTLTEGQN